MEAPAQLLILAHAPVDSQAVIALLLQPPVLRLARMEAHAQLTTHVHVLVGGKAVIVPLLPNVLRLARMEASAQVPTPVHAPLVGQAVIVLHQVSVPVVLLFLTMIWVAQI